MIWSCFCSRSVDSDTAAGSKISFCLCIELAVSLSHWRGVKLSKNPLGQMAKGWTCWMTKSCFGFLSLSAFSICTQQYVYQYAVRLYCFNVLDV